MKDKKGLISSAMLTAIWDEKQQDNIDLLSKFVIHILAENYKEKDIVDCSKISKCMCSEFSFYDFPDIITKKILKRLSKKGIVKKNNYEYILSSDLSTMNEAFKNDKAIIINETEKVIKKLQTFLVEECGEKYNKLNEASIEKIFIDFLDTYGYITYRYTNKLKDFTEFKKNQNNYNVAKFILKEFENSTDIFDYIIRITTGLMISSVISIQSENDNKRDLKNLDIYIDSPLMLRILGYKTIEQNESARQLVRILKEKNANIKCFENNYEEIKYILQTYKKNIGSLRDKTLETLDMEDYTETQVEGLIYSLRDTIKTFQIEIVDRPDFSKHEAVIEEKELNEFLQKKYAKDSEAIIDNDIKSISAIYRIRGSREEYKCVEDSKAIFVTTNYKLIGYVNECLKIKKTEDVGSAIKDTELLILMWLKTYKNNPELPRKKLIENARLAIQPSSSMLKRFKDTVDKYEKLGGINQTDIRDKLIDSNYYKSELMILTNGDEEKINIEVVKGIIEKENNELKLQMKMLKEKDLKREKEMAEKEKNILEEKNKIIQQCSEKSKKISNYLKYLLFIIIYGILGIVFIVVLISDIRDIIKTKTIIIDIKSLLVYGIELIALIDTFYGRFNWIRKIINKVSNKAKDKLNVKYVCDRKKEMPTLFD